MPGNYKSTCLPGKHRLARYAWRVFEGGEAYRCLNCNYVENIHHKKETNNNGNPAIAV